MERDDRLRFCSVPQRENSLKTKEGSELMFGQSRRRLRSVVKRDTGWLEDCSLSPTPSVTAGSKDFFSRRDAWRRMTA